MMSRQKNNHVISGENPPDNRQHHKKTLRTIAIRLLLLIAFMGLLLSFNIVHLSHPCLDNKIPDNFFHQRGRGEWSLRSPKSQRLSYNRPELLERFLTSEDRVKLYMGSWYKRDARNVAPKVFQQLCRENGLRDVKMNSPVLLSRSATSNCIAGTRNETHLLQKYCEDVLSFFERGREEYILAKFGDGTSFPSLPTITKAKGIAFRDNTIQYTDGIVWPLNIRRHFGGIQVVRGIGGVWKDKKETIIWRGASTGSQKRDRVGTSRYSVVQRYFNHSSKAIDIAFTSATNAKIIPGASAVTAENIPRPKLLEYKYLLSLEGNDVASGLKWMLYSDSVVFMARPRLMSWALESELQPFVHYVPVSDDYSNIPEMVAWARSNDDVCRDISRRATDFVSDLLFDKDAEKNEVTVNRRLRYLYSKSISGALKEMPPACFAM